MRDIQALLADGESIALDVTLYGEAYVFAVTPTKAVWKRIGLRTPRWPRWLPRSGAVETGKPLLFDLAVANDLYGELIGHVDDLVRDARHPLIVPSGPLALLPFHLLVTAEPTA